MGYIVEKMTEEDIQRAMDDFMKDPKKSRINRSGNISFDIRNATNWAVDRENDSYFFWGPFYIGVIGTPKENYSFYYRGRLYWLIIHKDTPPHRLLLLGVQ